MRKSLLVVLPCALGLAAPAQAQSLPQAVQQALEVHPEVRAGVNGRLAADYELKAPAAVTGQGSTCSRAMAAREPTNPPPGGAMTTTGPA